jgi:hypothetical protein
MEYTDIPYPQTARLTVYNSKHNGGMMIDGCIMEY